MNKIFKVVWSKTKECYVVVSEVAKNNGGKKKVLASVLAGLAMVGMGATVQAADMNTDTSANTKNQINIWANTTNKVNPATPGATTTPGSGVANANDVDPSQYGDEIGIAIGAQNKIKPGITTNAGGGSSIAMGIQNEARGNRNVVIGTSSKTYGENSIALGTKVEAGTGHGIAIGSDDNGKATVAYGGTTPNATGSNVGNAFALAIGSGAQADGRANGTSGGIAIGQLVNAKHNNTIAIGVQTTASGSNSTVIGSSAEASGSSSAAYGTQSNAKGTGAAAIGPGATTDGDGATALGRAASAKAESATALGRNAEATIAGGVALGFESKTTVAAGVQGYNPATGRTRKYSDQGGAVGTSTLAAVSIGVDSTKTRQLTGLAAGTADTDAVNVAQLKNVNLKYAADTGNSDLVLKDHTLNINGDNDLISTDANTTGVKITAKVGKNITTNSDGKAVAPTTNGIATTDNVTQAINNSGWKVTSANNGGTTNGTTSEKVSPGDTVTFSAGKNIVLDQAGKQFTYSLNKDVDLTNGGSLTIGDTKINNGGMTITGGPSVTKTGIDAGSKKITNVAPGTDDTDAVNYSQIKGLRTEVKAGAGVTVTPSKGTDGHDIYTVSANATGGAASTESVVKKAAATGDTNIADVSVAGGKNVNDPGAQYEVSVSKNAVKDAAREAVTVNNGGNTDNPITVTPTDDATNHNTTYAVTFDGDKAAKQIPLTYKANGTGDKTVKLDKGLDFTNGTNTTAEIGNDGVVKFNLKDNVALTNAGSLTVGDTKVNNDGLTINGGPSVTTGGIDAGSKKITNVEKGTADTDAVNVKQLKDSEKHIKPDTYTVANDGSVTLKYVDGNGTEQTETAKITGIAKQDLSNIDNAGKQVITGLGTVVKAGDNVTVTEASDATTGKKTYTVNAVTPAVYTKADGTKVVKRPDGTFTTNIDGSAGNDVPASDVIVSFQDAAGNTIGGNSIVNNVGSAIDKTGTSTGDTFLTNLNNAATDNPFAAVNVRDLKSTADALKASELHIAPTAVKAGSTEAKGGVASGAENVYKYDAATKKVTLTYNDGNGKAVTDTKAVIDFSDLNVPAGGNNYGFKANATANGGTVEGTATETAVENGGTVNFAAGKNLTVKQDIDAANKTHTYTYSLDKDLTNLDKVVVNGKDGVAGKDGVTIVGPQGATGATSIPGTNGIDGKVGITGKDGKDAVSIAGKDGVGTIGLTGPQGPAGTNGKSVDISTENGTKTLVKPEANNNDQSQRIVYVPKDANGNPLKDADNNDIKREVATMDDGLKFTGNNESTENKQKLGSLVKVQGEGTKEGADATGAKEIQTSDGTKFESAKDNIAVEADGANTLTVKLNKDLKGLDSVTTKEVKLGDANDNISIKKDGDRITYTTPGSTDTHKVATLDDEMHIKDTTYTVDANKKVTLTYVDGNSKDVAGKKAIIDLSGLPVGDKDTDMRIKDGNYTATNGSVTLNTVDKDGNTVAGKDVVIKGINTNNYVAGDNVTFTNNGNDANGNPIVKINAEVSTEQVVAKAGNDNLATVAPATGSTQGGKNATYEVNVDKTNLENKAEISYKANGGTAQKTTLAKGFNFTSDDNSVAITTGADGKVNFKVDTSNVQGKAFNLDVNKEGTGKVENAQTAAATPSVEKGTKFVAGNNLSIRHDGINGDANYDHQVTYALNSDLKGITSITNNGGATMNFGPNEVSITGGNLNMGGNKITNVKNGTDKSDVATVGQLTKVTSNDNTVAINKTTDADGAPVYDLSVQGGGHDPRVDELGEEVGRVGAQGAALAALKPIQYDPLEPTQIMAGYGNYRGNSAIAMGVAHYKNESTLMHAGVSWAGGSRHMMANAGVTWKVGNRDSEAAVADRYRKGPISSAYAMQQEMASVKAQNAGLKTEVSDLKAENEQMKAQIAAMMAKLGM